MRRWNAAASESHGTSEVNLTPLIDVSLVLVVILLLATPLAFESSFGLRQARASAQTAADDSPSERIEVAILADDSVRVNRTVMVRSELADALDPLLERSATGQVSVTCRDSVSHGAFVGVLDVIKQSGARDIAVAGS